MDAVSIATSQGTVEGQCDPRFREVQDAFVANFEHRGEVGASVSITVEGRRVVDLWGGRKSVGGDAWTRDTACVVFSSTKGASALCAHIAADRGLLDLDAPVSRYWPEFAQGGKEGARVSMMLDHSVGVPHIRERLKPGAVYDYMHMVGLLEREEAFWKPGTRHGYHGLTNAWTVGEMVRRSTGQRMGEFLAQEVCGPQGIEFWMGLPEAEEHRIAPVIPYAPDEKARTTRIALAAKADPTGPTALFMTNMGGMNPNSREARAAEIGSATGVSNGRGLADLYAPLANGGALDGQRLLSHDAVVRMGKVSVATHEDATLQIPTRFSLGYMKSVDNRRLENAEACSAILTEAAFGHVGAGGSIGFADPECAMSFGYAMNRMGLGILLNDRGQSLVDAAYRSLGYRSDAGGAWTR